MVDLYDYSNYKNYLQAWIAASPRKGVRSRMASKMNCQLAYLSRVLKGNAHLSLEQAHALNDFLNHDGEKSKFFLLLIQLGRAGTIPLKRFFGTEIQKIKEQRLRIKERISVAAALTAEAQAVYYSAWYYSAIHVLLSVPEFQKIESISEKLSLQVQKVEEVLEFLTKHRLAEKQDDRFALLNTRIHLPNNSPLVRQHHGNWRLRALQTMEQKHRDDLHYSAVVTMDAEKFEELKNIFLSAIDESEKMIRKSNKPKPFSICFDLFEV